MSEGAEGADNERAARSIFAVVNDDASFLSETPPRYVEQPQANTQKWALGR